MSIYFFLLSLQFFLFEILSVEFETDSGIFALCRCKIEIIKSNPKMIYLYTKRRKKPCFVICIFITIFFCFLGIISVTETQAEKTLPILLHKYLSLGYRKCQTSANDNRKQRLTAICRLSSPYLFHSTLKKPKTFPHMLRSQFTDLYIYKQSNIHSVSLIQSLRSAWERKAEVL